VGKQGPYVLERLFLAVDPDIRGVFLTSLLPGREQGKGGNSLEEAVNEFVRLSQQIHGCKAALAELPEEPISYGWLGLDFWLLADDDVLKDATGFQSFIAGVQRLHAKMMKRWYPAYWHPFSWLFENGLDRLGPLEGSKMEKASVVYGDMPKMRQSLEAPVLYYASRLRNDSCQIRRWLYAYGPEGMAKGNWGKFVGWTERICTAGLAIAKPAALRRDDPLNCLGEVVEEEEARTAREVLAIGQADTSTARDRRALFPTLVRSVGFQRGLASRVGHLLQMDHQGEFEAPRQMISAQARAGHRPRLAAIENRLLERTQKALDDKLLSTYLSVGEPSSVIMLARDADTAQTVETVSELYPSGHDIFTWLAFEEELQLFTHESPAEFIPDCFGLIQPRQLVCGDDLITRTTVPLGRSALSCLNSFLPMVRAYSLYAGKAQAGCEPQGAEPWIDSWYSTARLLIALCRSESPTAEILRAIACSPNGAPKPRTVEEGILEIETAASYLNA